MKFSEGPGGYGDGLSNYSVGQRELDVLDTLTSNRDKVIWGTAQGKSVKPDDSNLPEFIPVMTSKPRHAGRMASTLFSRPDRKPSAR